MNSKVNPDSPIARLAEATALHQSAKSSIETNYHGELTLETNKHVATNIILADKNQGEGRNEISIDIERAAWLAQQLIRIYGLTPVQTNGGFWMVNR